MTRLPTVGADNNSWGAILDSFLQVGHNATGTLIGIPNVFNVKDDLYGAKGDGTTDDTTAIQAAITACQNAGGGTVYCPTGTYQISSNLTITNQGVHLAGAGRYATTLRPTAGFANAQMIYVSGGSLGGIRDMSFSGISSTYTSNPACNAIQLNVSNDFYMQNLYFNFLNGWCIEVADTGGSFFCSFLNIRMGTVLQGIHLKSHSGGSGSGAYIANCFLSGQNGDGLLIEDIADVTCVNLEGGNAASGGATIHIKGDSRSLYFSNFDLGALVGGASYSSPQVLIEASGGHSPADIQFIGGILEAGTPNVSITAGSNIRFIGTRFFKGGTHGISVSGTTDLVLLQGCEFDNDGWTAGVSHYDINWSASGHCKVVSSFFDTPGGTAQGQVADACNFTAGISEVYQSSFLGAFAFNGFPTIVRGCAGYNPVGNFSVSVPASGADFTGRSVDVTYFVTGGTVSSIKIAGVSTGLTSGTFRVPAQSAFNITYSVVPSVTAFGD